MYEYIVGRITAVTPYYVVLENNGVGFQLFVANPFRYQIDEQQQRIYVYQVVRDNDISLFGFKDRAEKQLFLKLLSVSGIGPKSALAILANDDHNGLVTAINSDDDGYLTKFPGIGKKTAKQIILDLKGKMDDVEITSGFVGQQGLNLDLKAEVPYLEESVAALLALGYTKTEVNKIIKKLKTFDGQSTDEYLRYALKLLMNK